MTKTKTAILAGGCFWGVEDLFRKLPGVVSTKVGYTGGATKNATYKDVKTGKTGHAEAILITYDPAATTFRALLEFFFQIHDPTTIDRQGNDVGSQYRSAIFYLDAEQKTDAETVIAAVNASGKWPGKVVTAVEPAGEWWDAEDFHQDYLIKYPDGYTCHFVRPNWKLSR
ncbi:MAG: peptide-methionine (S)-S-oxide reductase MsrA [Parvularculaceae bacterium]|nr:peptide-methionine (S)-S-oxide reductase MsrA [Parvularculaceae bacterium]